MKLGISKRIVIFLSCCMMAFMTSFLPALSVNAATVYVSDGIAHDEGYIFIGESHMQVAAFSMQQDALGNIPGLEDVQYFLQLDSSIVSDDNGGPGTFTMSGNLFFVFEGTGRADELKVQISKEYIYSDGAGTQGGAVQKIHTIMDTNPNIAHWNIISFHGANAALRGSKELADYYAASYRNWIDYEFPDADCYFLPQSTMTKNFKIFCKDKEVFNRTLAEAFPENYLDIMPFFWEHYPQGLMDPQQKSDLVHWSDQTYYEMVCSIINQTKEKRALGSSIPMQEPQMEIIAQNILLYTNDMTVIYEAPDFNGSVLLPSCEAGLPIQVTGVTSNGYFQIQLGETVGYVMGNGLSAQ
ncbi:MAG: hypothetical protein HDR25_00580 [Lachnospiraceae bacterium]|nr:hypothetical protein [Lachnospiraceae bacterium]